MSEVTIEAVSKFGVLVNGSWLNLDKNGYTGPSLNEIQKGAIAEIVASGKYLKELKIKGQGSVPSKPSQSKTAHRDNPEVQSQICRGNACNAVYGSPVLAEALKNMDASDVASRLKAHIEQTAHYIATGKWTEEA